MLKRIAVSAVTMTLALAAQWNAPANALPLPLLPHLPFYETDTLPPSSHPEPLTGESNWSGSGGAHLDADYVFNGQRRTVGEFLNRSSTRGFLVLRDNRILDERYFGGYSAASRFNSWSVGKSITAAAVGIAVADGKIGSVDDPVTEYLPELATSGYNGVRIRDVLHMSSGIAYDESTNTDPTKGSTNTMIRMVAGISLPDQARGIPAERPPGTLWNYASMDSFVLGWIVAKVTGAPLSEFVRQRIWEPAGMASEALMGHDYAGNTIGFCCYHATVRDFARFGLLYLHDGDVGGRQIVPRAWIHDSTHSTEPYLQPRQLIPARPNASENAYGYGYQWWLGDGDRGDYTAVGFLGQFIYVSPRDNIVIVKTSEDLNSTDHMAEALQAFRALADATRR
ncbi:serine hydrolase domain-containing protein [Nocardia sp. NPDC058058]|uniref:serine hydrolase domain-containing protein n=1 Tax=Nocardia sp. NPDC058058 TaxID=3346317 RepID=UPI0036DAAD9E